MLRRQQSEDTELDLLPDAVESVLDADTSATLEQSLTEMWRGFVDHLPLLILGLVALFATGLLAMAIRFVLEKLLARTRVRRSLRALIARLVYIGAWGLGLLLVAMIVFPGLTPTKALGGLGVASVAVGFAFQDIFENFFAGILILWRFPFDNGDVIRCGELLGTVEEITVRNTLLRRPSGEILIVPNSRLFKEPVEVLTGEETRRIEAICGVAYGEEARRAKRVIEEALSRQRTVRSEPAPEVLMDRFGSSSVDLALLWWTGATPIEVRRSRSEVLLAVKSALDEAGIEIPFPYRTLVFKQHDAACEED